MTMQRRSPRFDRKRLGCTALVWTFLLQTVTPAYATSTGYTGFVSQLPGVYTTPPDVNVMFTLDDSGSMQWESIPDSVDGVLSGMWSNPGWVSSMRRSFLSSNALSRYYRSPTGNPIYYNPDVTYTPWPFANDDTKIYPRANPAAACYSLDFPSNPMPSSLPGAGSALSCTGTGVNGIATLDLTARVTTSTPDDGTEAHGYWPATYFKYIGPAGGLTPNGNATDTTTNSGNLAGNFTKVEIKSSVTSYPQSATSTRTDCASASACTYAEEIQNFANWFTYYRTRRLMAKGGAAAAFAKQGTNIRVGFASLHSNPVVRIGVRQFSGTNRSNFYNDLYPLVKNGGTPLLDTAEAVGQYFTGTGNNSPWAYDPAAGTKNPEYACRRSFHILTTDGFWNGNSYPSTSNGTNTTFSGNTPAKPNDAQPPYTYTDKTNPYAYSNAQAPTGSTDPLLGRFSIDPFADNVGSPKSSLADIAAYYWKTDLRPDLENRVAPSARDPAYWQHLTTFTVGLGINGTGGVKRQSDNTTTVPASVASAIGDSTVTGTPWIATQSVRDYLISQHTALVWPQPVDDDPTTGDDLIHASMVGRGRYFSATNPTDLSNGLATALSEVADQPLDQASVAADAPQVRAGSKVYQATFNPAKWFGRLYAFNQSATGTVNNRPTDSTFTNPDQAWEASNKMPLPGARNIFTSTGNTGTGTTFTWAQLTSTQQTALNNDANLLNYLRGDATREVAKGGPFRDRSRYKVGAVTGGVLGDIVNGSPIKGPDGGGGYDRLPPSDPAQAAYTSYRSDSTTSLDNMRNTIFASANDGMLHAFSIVDGVERFAYVPNAVYEVPRSTPGGLSEQKLRMLADPTYTHRFTVDGPPNVSDAYLGSTWKTLLVASNGAGARGIFAIDVTNPAVGAGAFGTSKILWEFTEANHNDMGFVLGYPHVVRMRDGTWAVILGNGYDSINGKAKLFILNAQTGAVMKEFQVGTAGDNGLGQPNFVVNANREVVAIYVGDLKGNLWKFDVSDTSSSNWKPAFGSSPTWSPLFTATSATGGVQPITAMPEITAHPNGGAVIVFGTGKLFESSDTNAANPPNVNLGTQSFYGIWDKPLETTGIAMTAATRATVLQGQTAPNFGTSLVYAGTSTNAPDWTTKRGWYMDLGSGGERANLPPQQIKNVVLMVANTPVIDPCANGGSSKIFILDPITGAAPSFPVFDTNNDAKFDSNDAGNVRINRSGLLTQPIFQLPSLASYTANAGVTVAPFSLFDRGQASAARGGGVELQRATGGTTGNPALDCAFLMTAAQSDTSLLSLFLQTCPQPAGAGKARISWRQLK
jgi:type IV pilus assembly protein PilY1